LLHLYANRVRRRGTTEAQRLSHKIATQPEKETLYEKQQRWIIGAAIGCLLVAGLGRVEAKEIPNNGNFAGTFLGTRIDRNDDGVAANWQTGVTTGNLGKRIFQVVSEFVRTDPTAACPGGVFIIDAPTGKGFGTFTETFPNGDQYYARILTSTSCSDGVGGFTGSTTISIVGGIGKFAGASGNIENNNAGFFQAFDANANPAQGFGSFSGEFEGTLILPNGGHDKED
jgi:hypothetical protein